MCHGRAISQVVGHPVTFKTRKSLKRIDCHEIRSTLQLLGEKAWRKFRRTTRVLMCLRILRTELEQLIQEKMAHVEELRQIHQDINAMEQVDRNIQGCHPASMGRSL